MGQMVFRLSFRDGVMVSEIAGRIEPVGECGGDLLPQGQGHGAWSGMKEGCRAGKNFVKLSFINHTEVNHGRSESRDDDQGGPGRHGH